MTSQEGPPRSWRSRPLDAEGWLLGLLLAIGLASSLTISSPVNLLSRWVGSDPLTAQAASSGLLLPVAGVSPAALRDTYGDRRSGARRHQALDIMAPRGTPVLATAAGTVVEVTANHPLGGLAVYQIDLSGRWCYYYAHLDSLAHGVGAGSVLAAGQKIGEVGTSGNAPKGAPHLHFAILEKKSEDQPTCWQAEPVNPYPLLGGR